MNLYGFFLVVFFVVTMGGAFARGVYDEPESKEYTLCYSASMKEVRTCMIPNLIGSPFR